jgi:hypothetical protein
MADYWRNDAIVGHDIDSPCLRVLPCPCTLECTTSFMSMQRQSTSSWRIEAE